MNKGIYIQDTYIKPPLYKHSVSWGCNWDLASARCVGALGRANGKLRAWMRLPVVAVCWAGLGWAEDGMDEMVIVHQGGL